MPRTARKISKMNIYHVMLRGVNRQVIFEEDEDRRYFMSVLQSCKEVSGFRLHAFCLMPNHVHLLTEPSGESLDTVFKRIDTRYAVWYNRKYQRTGHLFQDRFKSECVDTPAYYMTVLRYILQNPMKAGMERQPGSYRWSSYLAYEKGGGSITDTQFATELFGSREMLIDFVQQNCDDSVMDDKESEWRVRDDQAKEIMIRMTQCHSVTDFQRLDPQLQKEYIGKLHMEKLTMDQIAKMTGLSAATVYRRIKSLRLEVTEEEPAAFKESGMYLYRIESSAGSPDGEEIW